LADFRALDRYFAAAATNIVALRFGSLADSIRVAGRCTDFAGPAYFYWRELLDCERADVAFSIRLLDPWREAHFFSLSTVCPCSMDIAAERLRRDPNEHTFFKWTAWTR
jgi:hypothetical protein